MKKVKRWWVYTGVLAMSMSTGCIKGYRDKDINEQTIKVQQAQVDEETYELGLSGQCLWWNEQMPLLDIPVLDFTCYDLDGDGQDELIVLGLGEKSVQIEGRQFGDELLIYTLARDSEMLEATLCYTNDLSLAKPWMIEVGKIDEQESYANIFVGVYKDTLFYKEMINRPFFFSWTGAHIEAKWTGSFLSYNELWDLVFVDFIGDGIDEIAVLEQQPTGEYRVALYKWLSFGFEKLLESPIAYTDVLGLRLDEEGRLIIVMPASEEVVVFK